MKPIDTLTSLAELLWPKRCAACGCRVYDEDDAPTALFCELCAESLMPITSPRCPRCALPFEGSGPDHLCGECLRNAPDFSAAVALYQYGEAAAKAVTRLKYAPMPHLARGMGRALAGALGRRAEVDVVVPVPLFPGRLRERGFNQSALIGRPIARALEVPEWSGAVVRHRATASQAGLTREGRIENIKGAFRVRTENRINGLRILLVDDVITTGATVREIARCLRRAGARDVQVAAFARAC